MLKIENLQVHYDKVQVIHDVSLEVNEGEIVTLIGSNGAGKTTLLRTISGIKRASGGSITFMGEPIHQMTSHKIVEMGIGHVPEGRHVFPDMSVYENLQMGAFRRKDSQAAIKKDLEHIFDLFPRLKERSQQMAGTMSGGEQQMLAIGRAIMAKPKLFLFDEPSLGIAPIIVAEIFKMIKKMNEEGSTILLVEQNANAALKISDRAYILETGKIGLEGQSSDLLNDDRVRKIYLGF
ncbi:MULTISPECIES: ABC transporter ATP-binding protein [Neobacillus]|uniref:ABC transporter ATP-binding protein n=1 Tax=Neobacillus rhizophilus TaxID=2833579 RepID=A0A942U1L9_9BACI|nr:MULTISPECIES: ABC transporter ATP-binding protein [Neobacillus]MBS4210873.1 ABC transporter ATP-binding protein [Neobacillus rhizophilus]MBU8919767.1 ABC transporter ATP-binding protein [Bacillus sp. FJAT-29953]